MGMFLSAEEIATLTGRKVKSKQIEALRAMGLAYRVNATGHPVVTTAAVEGQKNAPPEQKKWVPNVMKAA